MRENVTDAFYLLPHVLLFVNNVCKKKQKTLVHFMLLAITMLHQFSTETQQQ